jgi:hypothetical protein
VRADAYAIEKIFDTPIQYRVPLYQRPYVWELNVEDPSEDRLTPFWEDVRDTVARYIARQEYIAGGVSEDELAAFNDHFFGAIVLGKLDKSFGGIPHQEVIDGQQRFTTAQLLIAAAHRLAQEKGFETTADVLRDLYLNPDKHEPQPHERPKLWPTNANRVAYAAMMDPDGPLVIPDDPGNRIQEAYAYFEGEIAAWLEEMREEDRETHMKALHRVLRTHLKFVVIELEAGDNAQEIFESLNAQGTPLLAIDLVKNHVFRRADDAKIDLDDLDEGLWRELDAKWWRREQRQGRFKRPRAELFLMHWLTMRKRDEVPALGLFVEFQRQFNPEAVPNGEIRAFVERFIADARLYRSFYSLPEGTRARRFFDRLDLLDTTTLYPVVLRLFVAERDGELSAEERDQALAALESWLVRRMICDFTPKNYNRVAVDLLRAIEDSAERPHLTVTGFLCEATVDTEIWPGDPLLFEVLRLRPLYSRIKPVRRVRLLLEACELERRRASGGFAETTEQAAPQLGMSLTVEHVLPQSWPEHWPLPTREEIEEWRDPGPDMDTEILAVREGCIHLLGNLTLVTKKLNPSVGNSAWPVKRKALDEHSILHLNRDLVRDNEEDWTEWKIDLRSGELSRLLADHWPGPERFCQDR